MPHAVAANAKHLLSLLFYIDANNFSVLIILVCFRFVDPGRNHSRSHWVFFPCNWGGWQIQRFLRFPDLRSFRVPIRPCTLDMVPGTSARYVEGSWRVSIRYVHYVIWIIQYCIGNGTLTAGFIWSYMFHGLRKLVLKQCQQMTHFQHFPAKRHAATPKECSGLLPRCRQTLKLSIWKAAHRQCAGIQILAT